MFCTLKNAIQIDYYKKILFPISSSSILMAVATETKINGTGTCRRAISLSRESPSCRWLPEQGVLPAQSSWDPGPCSQHKLPPGGCSHMCWGRRLSVITSEFHSTERKRKHRRQKSYFQGHLWKVSYISAHISLAGVQSLTWQPWMQTETVRLVLDWAAMRRLKWEGCNYDRNSEKGHRVTVNCLCIHPHSGLVKMAFHYEIYLGWIVFQNV